MHEEGKIERRGRGEEFQEFGSKDDMPIGEEFLKLEGGELSARDGARREEGVGE